MLSHYWYLNMRIVTSSSKMLVYTYETALCHIKKPYSLNVYHHLNPMGGIHTTSVFAILHLPLLVLREFEASLLPWL